MDSDSVFAFAVGASSAALVGYFLCDKRKKPVTAPGTVISTPGFTPPLATAGARPCALHLTGEGLTVDGERTDIAGAVARCQAVGGADLIVGNNAPSAVLVDLAAALTQAGMTVASQRNGRMPRARHRRRGAPGVDLAHFAQTVQRVAARIETEFTDDDRWRGRFGDRKVFISAIRRALASTEYGKLPRFEFNRLLVDAQRESLLVLARADLVAAMDPREVRDSEVKDRGAVFHFVLDERPENRNAANYQHFTLRIYPDGYKGAPTSRWYRTEAPIQWATARDRLIAAGIVDAEAVGRTYRPGGWMLSVDPADYYDKYAEALP